MERLVSVVLIILFTIHISVQPVLAQEESAFPYFRHFDVYDGIAGNEAYYVYQDQEKCIWICTQNGVTRFNGVKFKNYSVENGLCFNTIFGCAEDQYKNLWFYSFTGELSVYNRKADKFESPRFNDSLSHLVAGRVIQSLTFRGDTLCLATTGCNFEIFHSTERQYVITKHLAPYNSIVINISRNNEISCLYGTSRLCNRIRLIVTGKSCDTINNLYVPGNITQYFAFERTGELCYVIFGENLLEYNLSTHAVRVVKTPFSCTPCLKKAHGNLITGSFYNGMWAINAGANNISFTQLLKDIGVSAVSEDYLGGIWCSSQENGVYYIPDLSTLAFPSTCTNRATTVNNMYRLNSKVYYSTYNGGLYGLFLKQQHPYKRQLLPFKIKTSFMGSNDKKLFIRSDYKAYLYDWDKGISDMSDLQYAMCIDKKVTPAVTLTATGTKLHIDVCYGNNNSRSFPASDNWQFGRIRNTAITETGNILLGNNFDLFLFDTATQTIHAIGAGNNYTNLDVTCITPLKKNSAAIGTSKGIFFIDSISIQKNITVQDGLDGNSIYCILPDGDRLFVATSKGINCIEAPLSDAPVITSFSYAHGINICPANCMALIDSFLVAGTDHGIFLFNKQHISPRRNMPEISGVYVNNQAVAFNPGSTLQLKHYQNSLRIIYSSKNFTNALYNKFRYRLAKGADTAWSYTSTPALSFSSLSPGNYRFDLQAMNSNGSWNTDSAGFLFAIALPFWQTSWFILLCIVVTFLTAYYVFRSRIKQLNEVNTLRFKLSEIKFQALGMQLNPHFVFNAMNSVSSSIARNDAKTTLRYLGKFAKLMRLVFKNSQSAIIPLEEELAALRIYLELESTRLNHRFGYSLTVEETVNVYNCKIPSLLLQPFIENAIWHGIAPLESGGKISIHLYKETDFLVIQISDNGIGRQRSLEIKRQNTKEKRSLEIIRERLQLLEQYSGRKISLEITDNKFSESGTTVTISIPCSIDIGH